MIGGEAGEEMVLEEAGVMVAPRGVTTALPISTARDNVEVRLLLLLGKWAQADHHHSLGHMSEMAGTEHSNHYKGNVPVRRQK